MGKKNDASSGAVGKAILSKAKNEPPVFILHDMVSVPIQTDVEENASIMGVDVSHKAKHYRILFRMATGDWHAYKIVPLPPMQYFNTMSRDHVTQMGRTQLLANSVADQISSGVDDTYANRPDNYTNLAV